MTASTMAAMTAEEFVELFQQTKTPAGRFDLLQRGLNAGLITAAQAHRLFDFPEAKPKLRLVWDADRGGNVVQEETE